MRDTTTIRVNRATHEELKRLARQHESTVTETVSRAVRLLRQEEMGRQLAEPLGSDEDGCLNADLG